MKYEIGKLQNQHKKEVIQLDPTSPKKTQNVLFNFAYQFE